MDRDQTTLAGSGRCDHADHEGIRETPGAPGDPKVARRNNGAKSKLLAALASGPKSLDELVRETGLTRIQVITNMHYLKSLDMARPVWVAPKRVSRWIRALSEAVEEART